MSGLTTTPTPSQAPQVFYPSIEEDLFGKISLVIIGAFYFGIVIIALRCCFGSGNKISNSWYSNQGLELDLILEDEVSKEKANGEVSQLPSEEDAGCLKRIFKHTLLKSEVWLARNGKIFAFYIFLSVGLIYQILDGVYLETVDYPTKPNKLLAIAVPIGRGLGTLTNLSIVILLLVMCRVPMTWLSGVNVLALIIPFEETFALHKMFGYLTFVAGTVHGILQTVNYALDPYTDQTWGLIGDKVVFGGTSSFVSGWLILTVLILMVLTYVKPVKRLLGYQAFINAHNLWIVFLILMYFHGNRKGTPVFWKWGIFPTILLLIHYYAVFFGESNVRVPLILEKCSLDEKAKVIRLEMPRGALKYKAGQYAFIQIKELGQESHPFTIASSPAEPTVIFFIKVAGDWTQNLYELLKERQEKEDSTPIFCKLKGGFGAPSEFAYQFDDVVLVGTSVGATPFLSLVKDVLWSNSIQQYLKDEAYKLSINGEYNVQNMEKYEGLISSDRKGSSSGSGENACTHFRFRRWRIMNALTYGIIYQFILATLFLAEYTIAGIDNDINCENATNGTEKFELFRSEAIEMTWDLLFVIPVLFIVVGYSIDIFYRLIVESADMPRRQIFEIVCHVPVWCIGIFRVFDYSHTSKMFETEQSGEEESALQNSGTILTMVAAALSVFGWYLYIHRISGFRNLYIDKSHQRPRYLWSATPTKSLRFIYIDRKSDTSTWILQELKHIESIAKTITKGIDFSVEVYFTRDDQITSTAGDDIIGYHQGRPDWNIVVQSVVESQNRKMLNAQKKKVPDTSLNQPPALEDVEANAEECRVRVTSIAKPPVTGMFFCGSAVIGNAIREKIGQQTAGKHNKVVFMMEQFE